MCQHKWQKQPLCHLKGDGTNGGAAADPCYRKGRATTPLPEVLSS